MQTNQKPEEKGQSNKVGKPFKDATGRERQLVKLNGKFYIRFEHQGNTYRRWTKSNLIDVAIKNAKEIINSIVSGNGQVAEKMKARNDHATVREACEIYLQNFCKDERTHKTGRANVGSLRTILGMAGGLRFEKGSDVLEGLEKVRMTALTGELITAFEKAKVKEIKKDARGWEVYQSALEVRTSISSTVKQARSVFKVKHMHWFKDLHLPDLSSFRAPGVEQPDRPKPRPLDKAIIEAIDAAAPKLEQENSALYIAHLLFRYMGMRNSEIEKARWSWVTTDHTGKVRLGIINRPEEGFKCKKKTERQLPLAAGVLAALEKHSRGHRSPDGDFLVPARHKTERKEIVNEQHNAWVGKWIKDYTKVSYELRRYAGSAIYTQCGRLEVVQAFLGHADLATTQEWYWYLLEEIPSLDIVAIPSMVVVQKAA